jgi:AraC-like DNA-binding protein
MNPKPFKSVTFEWLSETGETITGTKDHRFGDSGWMNYPMPPESGKGGYEAIDLTIGMTFVRTTLEFSPSVLGKQLPMLEVDAEFNEPTFQAMAFRGLRGGINEVFPPARLAASPGIDLFRYTQHYRSAFFADATFSGEARHFSISRTVLGQLIGTEESETLLEALEINHLPSIVTRPIPLHISQLLFHALNTSLSGTTQKLFCQAKILEYLAALMHHVCASAEVAPDHSQKSRRRAQVIHAQLMATEGKLPTLDELAEQYGRSAKLLNEEFAQEFGKSVYGFITDHRLTQAHAALEHSDVTIKQLAAKIGYTHVNNFTIAFKRKFGYPPGMLRRR